jgi:ABC-2 type transport system permease protein
MRIILKIAKAELRSLFYSPIAWVIAIAFFVVCGVQFANPLEAMAAQQQFKTENETGWNGFNFSLTIQLFVGSYSFLLSNLYLFIPLLTMGLISREVHAGTIRLLYSSPIKTRHIVLGKYLGLMLYNAILLIPVVLLMITGCFVIASPDYQVYFSALLGFYLLSGTYMAIGLFVSGLTGYQIVAALLTFLVFAVLNNISQVGQQYDLFRDLTYFLNISGRVENLLLGLITSKDVFYFVLIMLLFVAFTLIKLKSRTESNPWYIYLFRYASAFVVVLLAGYFTSRPAHIAYLDVTRNKSNTIHPAVQKVIRALGKEPLKVTLYTNIIGDAANAGFPAGRNAYLWGLWGKYLRFHPHIDFRYVYYYDLRKDDSSFRKLYPNKTLDEIAGKVIDFNGIPGSIVKKPSAIRTMVDLEPEGKRLVMELEYKGKKTFLRTYDDILLWPDQMQMAGAIARLTRDTTPVILFVSGHYERSPYRSGEREYSDHTLNKLSRGALLNQGVDVDTINLQQRNIPANTSILVVADPKSAYTEEEQHKIRSYITNGGNAIFYGEPGKQQMLNPILQTIGAQLDDGIIVALNPHEMAQVIWPDFTDAAGRLALEPMLYRYQKKEIKKLIFMQSGAANISYHQKSVFLIQPLFGLPGSDTIWIERGRFVPDSAAPVYSERESDVRIGKYITGIKLTRTINHKEQRIIVNADADFMSAFRQSGALLGNACYSWLLKNEYPVYTNAPLPIDRLLTIDRKQSGTIWIIFVYIIPAIVLVSGSILLIRRKRK